MKMKYMLAPMLMIGAAIVPYKSNVRAQESPRRIEVTAKQFEFQPSEITVKKGQPVVLVIKSADVAHGLRFRDLKSTKVEQPSCHSLRTRRATLSANVLSSAVPATAG
jgi:heme/copper-type cytochrome/quinol oxidase subunit 2